MGIRAHLWPGLSTRGIWLEVLLALVGAAAVSVNTGAPGEPGAPPLPVELAGTAVLAVLLLLLRRRAPVIPFSASAVLTVLSPALTTAVLVTAYAVGRYEARWPARIGAAVLGCLAVVAPWSLETSAQAVGAVTGALLVVVLPGALGAWAGTRAELLTALRERAERAESERELLARDAVMTERSRIAREMHDAVGHRVSLMVLQAGAIEMAAGDPDRVATLAGQVQTAGRQALDELRQAVGVLRSSGEDEHAPLAPQPGLDDLERLVKECRTAGMAVELHAPPALAVDPVTSRAAYRIVQEALTNAGRHAPGAPVVVDVERAERELVVRVRNGAGRPADDAPGGGFGLVGLRERVRTLGGRLRAEPRLDGGFEVEAVLPT